MRFGLSLVAMIGVLWYASAADAQDASPKGPRKPAPSATEAEHPEKNDDAAEPDDSSLAPSQPASPSEKQGGAKSAVIEAKYVTVIKERPGQQTVFVHYPWKIHAEASVEVRLMPGNRAEKTTITPLCFVSDSFDAAMKQKFYRCLDHAEQGSAESVTKDQMEYSMLGQRNSLGRPAVSILPRSLGKNVKQRPAVVFPQLDLWAVNDRTLALDLPRDRFAQPGTLYVWFLRGDKVLWEDRVAWPGY